MSIAKKNILFVCTGNSCRSVMAEGFFKHLVKDQADKFVVGSAGVSAVDGYPASEETIRVMRAHGVDVSGHRSRRMTPTLARLADKIFVMELMHRNVIVQAWPEVSEKTQLLTEYSKHHKGRGLEIEIPDPIRMPDAFYKNVFQVIQECVTRIAEEYGVYKEAL